MSADIIIYVNSVIKFFNENPKELAALIPLELKPLFFKKVGEVAELNFNSNNDATLTRTQFIEICVQLDRIYKQTIYHETNYGIICYN